MVSPSKFLSFCSLACPCSSQNFVLTVTQIVCLLFFHVLNLGTDSMGGFWSSQHLPTELLAGLPILWGMSRSQVLLPRLGQGRLIESRLTLHTAQQANKSERWGVEARNTTVFRKPVDRADGRLMSQSNHLLRALIPSSFTEPEGGAMRS